MIRFVARRLLLAVPLLFVVSALSFVLISLAPGDPARVVLGANATEQQVATLNAELGLDDPIWVQYWHWVTSALTGDFGNSLISSQPVGPALWSRLPVTLSLVICATLVSAAVGIALGVFSALRGGAAGRATDALAMLGFAVPTFWLGWMLIDLFAVKAGWLPATGYTHLSESAGEWARSLVLPVVTLAAVGVTGIAKQTRDSMREVMSRDFVVALRLDGIPERQIILRHALRNAAVPVVTLIGVYFIGMLGGTVLVETIFAMPGLGNYSVSSAKSGDLTVVQGIVVILCIGVVIANLLVDSAYGWLNPKARVQ